MEKSRKNNEKVWFGDHMPMGHGGESTEFLATELPNVLKDYSDIILAGLYGHTHVDEIFIAKLNGTYVSSGLVTPSFLADNHNPSFRVYKYDKITSEILDYTNY